MAGFTDVGIVRALDNENYGDTNEVLSDCENEDDLLADNFVSNFHDWLSDSEKLQERLPSVVPLLGESRENFSSASNYIINSTQPNFLIKNRAIHREYASYRTSAINILRTARGPARSIKKITKTLDLFHSFMTDEICEKISIKTL